MSTTNDNNIPVAFTQKQYDWLNKQFPERIGTPTSTDAELRFSAGARSVVFAVLSKVQR